MPPPGSVKKPSSDAIALSQLGGLGLAPTDIQGIHGLDQNSDNYLDAGEVGRGLLSHAAPVVGRLFAAGVGRPLIDRGFVATFKNLNPPQQFSLLLKLPSPAQAQLLHALSKQAPASDLHYIWYQFVMAESGVLGGILLNHLRTIKSPLADMLPKDAEATAGATVLRKQLQDHLKIAQSVKNHAATTLRYFPSVEEARDFLQSCGVATPNGQSALPSALAMVNPHIRGPLSQGAVAVIHEGRGYIRVPKPQFFPNDYAVEVARDPHAAALRKRYAAGRQIVDEGRYDDAIRFFEAILVEYPQEVRATLEMGIVYIEDYNKTHNPTALSRAIMHLKKAVAEWQGRLDKDPNYFATRFTEEWNFEYAQGALSDLRNNLK